MAACVLLQKSVPQSERFCDNHYKLADGFKEVEK
jgi:hypothetical protein